LGRNPREPKRKMMNVKMNFGVEWESNGRQIEFPMGVEQEWDKVVGTQKEGNKKEEEPISFGFCNFK
jgi:hypothetical protein